MITNQVMAIGALVLVAGAFGVGMKMGSDGERQQCDKRIERVKAVAAGEIQKQLLEVNTAHTERDQARGEVAKVNAAQAEKTAAAEAAALADQAQRDAAVLRAEAAANQAARETRALNAKLTSSLEAIRNVADECARAPVSPDARKLLDGILAP